MSADTRSAIAAALHEHANDEWDGDLVVDWVIVAGLVAAGGQHSVGINASRDPMPSYVTVGLLSEGIRVSKPEG